MKLLTLNIEMEKHYDRVLSLIAREKPDVICLQEVPQPFETLVKEQGYTTTFAPMFILDIAGEDVTIGILFASRTPHTSHIHYYHRGTPEISRSMLLPSNDRSKQRETRSLPYIMAEVETPEGIFSIATTHGAVTNDGGADAFQTECTHNLLSAITAEVPHIFCGDFNMPRGHNALYDEFIKHYTDAIPKEYTSSLDRTLHKSGTRVLDVPIFDIYMVDYIFTQPPFSAQNVRFEFGVSDHAAVIADIIHS